MGVLLNAEDMRNILLSPGVIIIALGPIGRHMRLLLAPLSPILLSVLAMISDYLRVTTLSFEQLSLYTSAHEFDSVIQGSWYVRASHSLDVSIYTIHLDIRFLPLIAPIAREHALKLRSERVFQICFPHHPQK
jgi:hypothetical protein